MRRARKASLQESTMAGPLEHDDAEPLVSIVSSFHNQRERERVFQEALLWKIELLVREIQYHQHQVDSLIQTLQVPQKIVNLEKESETLSTLLMAERDRLSILFTSLTEEDQWKIGQDLLQELDQELRSASTSKNQGSITRVLKGYVKTGNRYVENYRATIESLTRRREHLEEELAFSRVEESKQEKMRELSEKFLKEHWDATYGEFRTHILRLLGKELERELRDAIDCTLNK
jgi:hypothetical protein